MIWRIVALLMYCSFSFLVLQIGFEWRISLSIGILVGCVFRMLNEIIKLLRNGRI